MPRCPALLHRTRSATLRLAAASALLAAIACSGDGGGPVGPNPTIAGHWSGTARLHTVGFEATFTQDGDEVGGTGHFSSPVASGDFTVAGSLSGATVDLLLTSTELGSTPFHGRFTGADRIEGTLELPGDDLDLTLDRD